MTGSNPIDHRPTSTFELFGLLVSKELRHVLLSPKFAAACLAVTVTVLLAVVLGLREHHAFEVQQESARRLLDTEQQQTTEWRSLRQRAFRDADPMQIFVAGVHRDLGRYAAISRLASPDLLHSLYSDEPIFAVFRAFDLAFVVTVVLSLFAIVFTYDAVSGERESGTLRLLAALAVPRSTLLASKAVGLWAALMVPIALASLLALAAVLGAGVELDADTWIRLGVFAAGSLLYVSFFAILGVATSANVQRSTTSFLALLAVWVLAVLVVPRVGLVAAVQAVPVPSAATLESQRQGFESRAWSEHLRAMAERWEVRNRELMAIEESARQDYEDTKTWSWIEEDDAARQQTEIDIQQNADRLAEAAGLREQEQRRLALDLARLSPAATYELVATATAGTGVDMAQRWQIALRTYRNDWSSWQEKASGGEGGRRILRRSSDSGDNIFDDTPKPIDLSDMPAFTAPRTTISQALQSVPLELGLLALETLLAFAIAWVGMLRYDVR